MLNNIQKKEAIKNRQSFKTVNSQGFYIGNEYIIKSYDTIIYSDSKGLDLKFYSQSTSKLQKIISLAFYNKDFTKQKRLKAIDGVNFKKLSVR